MAAGLPPTSASASIAPLHLLGHCTSLCALNSVLTLIQRCTLALLLMFESAAHLQRRFGKRAQQSRRSGSLGVAEELSIAQHMALDQRGCADDSRGSHVLAAGRRLRRLRHGRPAGRQQADAAGQNGSAALAGPPPTSLHSHAARSPSTQGGQVWALQSPRSPARHCSLSTRSLIRFPLKSRAPA